MKIDDERVREVNPVHVLKWMTELVELSMRLEDEVDSGELYEAAFAFIETFNLSLNHISSRDEIVEVGDFIVRLIKEFNPETGDNRNMVINSVRRSYSAVLVLNVLALNENK